MILSDNHKFIFIHIPKCGGTSVRTLLASYDSCGGRFTGKIGPLGRHEKVDYVHLPLNVLREHFPDIFAKLSYYKSFAIVRDPISRFGSALGQWFKNTKNEHILECSPAAIELEARCVLDDLISTPETLAPTLIHFRPQSDFIYFDGRRMVEKVFRLESIEAAQSELSAYLGLDLPALRHENQALQFRSRALKGAVTALRPIATPLWQNLPVPLKRPIYHALLAPPKNGESRLVNDQRTVVQVLEDAGLVSELEALYATDIQLYSNTV